MGVGAVGTLFVTDFPHWTIFTWSFYSSRPKPLESSPAARRSHPHPTAESRRCGDGKSARWRLFQSTNRQPTAAEQSLPWPSNPEQYFRRYVDSLFFQYRSHFLVTFPVFLVDKELRISPNGLACIIALCLCAIPRGQLAIFLSPCHTNFYRLFYLINCIFLW